MSKERLKQQVMVIVLAAFECLDEEERSAAFAEMVPNISKALFRGVKLERSDTQKVKVIPREEA